MEEDNFSQVALLYELSLTNLKHRKPEDNARKFIKKLLSRKALNYGAVWLFGKHEDDTIICRNLYSMPMLRPKVRLNVKALDGLFDEHGIGFSNTSLFFGNELEGHFAYFKLNEIGLLELYSAHDPQKISKESIYPLSDVVNQLAVSLESGFTFQRLQKEIAQRKVAQKYHQNSEEKYRKIIDNIHLGLMEVDTEENILFANESFLHFTGYEISDIVGKKASELFVNPKDRSLIEAENEKRQEGVSSFYELPIKDKKGNKKWAIISGAPIKDGNDQIVGSIGIHLDITEKKKREISERKLLAQLAEQNKKLNEKQSYLQAINDFAAKLIEANSIEAIVKEITTNTIEKFGFIDCVIYLLDENKKGLFQVSVYGSQRMENAQVSDFRIGLGEGIVGDVVQSGIPALVEDTSKDVRCGNLQGPGASQLAVPIIADGEVIGVIDSKHPDKGYYTQEHQDTLMTIANLAATRIRNAVIQDKRQKAEKALSESENKLRSIIDSALDAVITIDISGVVTEWNPQAEQLFGYTKVEVLGRKMSELIIPENLRKAHEMGMERFRETGETRVSNKRVEITGLHKNGEEFPVELSIKPITMLGKTFFSAFARDITQRKKAEEDMKMALEKQKELNKMKSQFVSMTSHEFRTPLTTIQTNVELLAFRLDTEKLAAKEKIDKNLERIGSELQRMTTLMNEILMMGKIESGNIPFKPLPQQLTNIIHEIIDHSFANEADGRKVVLKLEGKEREVQIDPNIYTHIITNLISNAFKYSSGGPNPELVLAFHDEHCELHVKDCGIGIPEADVPKLFNSFFRADNVGNIQGTGLGLAIVKEFIALHQGTIGVNSEQGKGTTFVVRQPYMLN